MDKYMKKDDQGEWIKRKEMWNEDNTAKSKSNK
jgi:hypothetical protein